MKTFERLIFHGDNREPETRHHDDAPSQSEPYIAATELVQAVNLAIHIGRPLLLEGEAGCGKTRLARAVAYELGLPLYIWHIKSTSKAQEGLYSYDAILRLHDVQIKQLIAAKHSETAEGESSLQRNPENPKDYRRFGSLGDAFSLKDCPAVVLIDEIDKADIDFPNDLLAVLDEPWEFDIPETGEKIKAKHKPIVIITSNKEKGNLPFPFLRRCIYYFVEFPNESTLHKIVEEHYKKKEKEPIVNLVKSAAERFVKIRSEGNLHKKPSTSEFLDWIEALHNFESTAYEDSLLMNEKALPYPSLLLKLRPDWQQYRRIL